MSEKSGSEKPPSRGIALDEVVDIFSGRGSPHPVNEYVQRLRELMLSLGFDEIQTDPFMDFSEVKAMTGPVFPVFRDAIYHVQHKRLAPIGPTPQLEVRIKDRYPEMDLAVLWNLIDTIDEETSAEEFMRSLHTELGLPIKDAVNLMNALPEITGKGMEDTHLTMRAFMPTAWMQTLQATYDPASIPIRLFTAAQNFRREASEDPYHLRTYNLLSIAIMGCPLDIDKAKSIVNFILDEMDVKDIVLRRKECPFPYFEEGTEMEIFGGEIEIGTFGLVRDDILKASGIECSVLLIDMGVERLLMYSEGYPDIRVLSFPQFHAAWDLTDKELASFISCKRAPSTEAGKEIEASILKRLKEEKESQVSKVTAWEGYIDQTHEDPSLSSTPGPDGSPFHPVEVVLREAKEGMGVCGPAAFDELFVLGGDIQGVPETERSRMLEKGAVPTGITYASAFAKLAAWKIERSLERMHASKRIEMVRGLQHINMRIDDRGLQFVLSQKKRMDVRAPVFLRFSFRTRQP